MIYIEQLDQTYPSLDEFLDDIITSCNEPEYVLSEIESSILEIFPNIDINNLDFNFNYWYIHEGPYRIGWDYNFSYDNKEFKERYPEFYV